MDERLCQSYPGYTTAGIGGNEYFPEVEGENINNDHDEYYEDDDDEMMINNDNNENAEPVIDDNNRILCSHCGQSRAKSYIKKHERICRSNPNNL